MMSIAQFANKYSTASRPIERVAQRWVVEKEVRDFLGTTVMAGATVADLMIGDRLVDTISSEVKVAFENLMGSVADSREEIEHLILEKIEIGDKAVFGLINKIQGQLGEDLFVRAVGSGAQLAESGSQADWDVRVNYEDAFKYVQVKVYENANAVPLENLKDKLEAGGVFDHGEVVNQLDVAVPSDIYAEVRERAMEIGYPGQILDLHITHDEIRGQLLDSVQNVQDGLGHFFTELVGDIAVPATIHGAVNAFLLYKGAKDRRSAVEDTVYSSAILPVVSLWLSRLIRCSATRCSPWIFRMLRRLSQARLADFCCWVRNGKPSHFETVCRSPLCCPPTCNRKRSTRHADFTRRSVQLALFLEEMSDNHKKDTTCGEPRVSLRDRSVRRTWK